MERISVGGTGGFGRRFLKEEKAGKEGRGGEGEVEASAAGNKGRPSFTGVHGSQTV